MTKPAAILFFGDPSYSDFPSNPATKTAKPATANPAAKIAAVLCAITAAKFAIADVAAGDPATKDSRKQACRILF